MKRSMHGTFLVITALFLVLVGSGCFSGGESAPSTQSADNGQVDANSAQKGPAEDDDGFFILQWTLKIGHIRRTSVRQPAPSTAPSVPSQAK